MPAAGYPDRRDPGTDRDNRRVRILSFPEKSVPRDLRRQVRDLQNEAWPPGDGDPVPAVDAPVHDPLLRPRSMLLVDGDTVLAALDILSTSIVHAGRRADADTAGTWWRQRAKPCARPAASTSVSSPATAPCGRSTRVPAGSTSPAPSWSAAPPTPPFASDRPGFDKVVMAAHFTLHGRLTPATFRSARIELHPGVIDRLW
ncbi:GNAT family N-acetyltransferase [Kitasatospora paranensis]|uniref:GNAT family N-acetyltransferase n=1 Tax=Kitasatospora paranensis TaxID=258053 RepID=A0ABW2FZQ0_9ACTN